MITQIRKGTEEDLPQVLALVQELAEYEKAPQEVTNTVEAMRRDGFGPNPIFEFYVAEQEDKLVGIALYYTGYSTWKGRMLYLEDIVVTESCRRSGIGHKLFIAVVKEAHRQKAKRMAWQVLEWNEPAIKFYQKIGATLDAEWINCRLHEEEIAKIVKLLNG